MRRSQQQTVPSGEEALIAGGIVRGNCDQDPITALLVSTSQRVLGAAAARATVVVHCSLNGAQFCCRGTSNHEAAERVVAALVAQEVKVGATGAWAVAIIAITCMPQSPDPCAMCLLLCHA